MDISPAVTAIDNGHKQAENTIMEKTMVAKFTGKGELLVKVHAEDHGFFRFEVLAGNATGSFLWSPATSIEYLREATGQEVASQEIKKQVIKFS